MNKFIQNVRRIAKTEELLARLKNGQPKQDKAPIGASRGVGVGLYDPCQLLYSSIAGTYSFADLVDGKAGPKVTDGKRNHCEFVNTINMMEEIDTSTKMLLKPDGMFLTDLGDTFYLSNYVNFVYAQLPIASQPWLNGASKYFYATKEAALSAGMQAATFFFSTTFTAGDLTLAPVTQDYLDNHYPPDVIRTAINLDTVTYKALVSFNGYSPGYESILEVPANYNYFTNRHDATFPWIVFPRVQFDGAMNYTSIASVPEAFYPASHSFQLALLPPENLWKPNPSETTAPLKYKNGVSIVKMDFGTNFARKGVVRPAKDGGFMLYETSSDVAINNIYIYRQDRTLAAVVPASQLNAYLA